jgi:hypothetical protein
MDGTKLPELPALGLAPGVKKENINPEKVVVAWLEKLDKWFQSRQDLASLFIDNCWWRDILGFDWDFTTKRGVDDIGKYLEGRSITNLQASIGGLKPILLDMGGMVWIQSGFTFKNEHGNGTGFVRLGNVSEGEWRAWIVFTQLEELSRQKEIEAVRNRSHAAAARASHVNGVAHEPQVLIVGAGQFPPLPTHQPPLTFCRPGRCVSCCTARQHGRPHPPRRPTRAHRRLLEGTV